MEDGDRETNDHATKQPFLLMRRKARLFTIDIFIANKVTSTSTFEFDCSHYFCGASLGLPWSSEDSENPNLMVISTSSVAGRAIRLFSGQKQRYRQVSVKSIGTKITPSRGKSSTTVISD